ncbi:MAG TPA: hypothetical protein VF334_04790 [Polyangia bacterium]
MTRAAFILVTLFAGATARATPSNASDPDMTGKRELAMLHCPSSAPGATTVVRDTRDGVELDVTAPDPFGRHEIRRRADVQKNVASARRTRGHDEHTGQGTGSGRYGYCPGIMQSTTVTVVDIAGGVRLSVRAATPEAIAELQRTTHARAARLQAPPRAAAKR